MVERSRELGAGGGRRPPSCMCFYIHKKKVCNKIGFYDYIIFKRFKKMSGDSIGMMEGAFFVSKGVILEWMNELLDVSTS